MKRFLPSLFFAAVGAFGAANVCAEEVDLQAISDQATEVLLLQTDDELKAQTSRISEKYANVLSTEDAEDAEDVAGAEDVTGAEDEEIKEFDDGEEENLDGNWKPVLPDDILKQKNSVPAVPQPQKVLSTEVPSPKVESSPTSPKISAEAVGFDPASAGLVASEVAPTADSTSASKWLSGNLVATWEDGFAHANRAMQLNQAWLTAERKAKTERGQIDWGGRVDATFGTTVLQSLGDRGFDGKWGVTGDGYGAALYQAYGEIAIGRLTTKVGKFATILEYEPTNSIYHGFNTHSYAKEHEPETHSGALFEYRATEKFTLKFGLTTGSDVSIENRRGDSGFLFGVGWELSERVELEYASALEQVHSVLGEDRALLSEGYYELGGVPIGDQDDYFQKVSLKMKATDRLTYGIVNDYGVMSDRAEHLSRYSQFGIGNYLSYAHDDKLTSNLRYEYYFQRLGSSGKPDGTIGNVEQHCHDLSYGLVYKPTDNLFVRPEIRYDWVQEAVGEREKGCTGGVACGFSF